MINYVSSVFVLGMSVNYGGYIIIPTRNKESVIPTINFVLVMSVNYGGYIIIPNKNKESAIPILNFVLVIGIN